MKKKGKRIIGIIAFILFGLPLLLVVFFLVSNEIYIGNVKSENIEYLKSNKSSTSNKNIDEDLFENILDEKIYDNNVILLGEIHGFADAQKIDLALLKHLNKKVGLRYYLVEMGSILGNILNTYINDTIENEQLLSNVVIEMRERIPQQASKEFYNKWQDIRNYNLTLSDSLKITVVGIDKNFINDLPLISRDSAMVKNLSEFVVNNNLQNEKFYGLFGYFHVLQKPVGKNLAKPFAARLTTSNIKSFNRISSLVIYHIDSEVYFPKNDQFPTPESERIGFLNDDGLITLVKGIKDLKKITDPETITLFSLVNEGSPYKKSQSLMGMKVNLFGNDLLPQNSENPTVDYFQYVLLGRDSQAVTKY